MQQNSLALKIRRHEISFLNVILCMAVIFIHIISYAVSGFPAGSVKYNAAMFPWRMASFAVQGFILLSGVKFFLTKKDEVPYGKYLLSRLKAIVIPYAVLFLIYYFFYYIVYDYPLDIRYILKMFFTGSLVCHLYFIPLIIQFDLLAPLWKKLVNNVSGVIVIPFCFAIGQIFEVYLPDMIRISFPDVNFIYNDRIFTSYLIYWIAGCYIGKNYDNFLAILRKNFKAIVAALVISLVVFGYYTYLAFNNVAYIPFMNHVHSLYVICMLCFLYAFSVKYSSKIMDKVKFISVIDKASYSIYLWHMLVLFAANFIIEQLSFVSQGLCFAMRVVFVYPVTIVWAVVISRLRTKIKNK